MHPPTPPDKPIKPVVLAFLQNMWVKNPEKTKAAFARNGDAFRRKFLEYALFAGCKTGRMLAKAFGDELIDRITFEETTREIAGDSKTILPVDFVHIKKCLDDHKPIAVLAFGNIAREAVQPLWPGKFIHAHHPASRHPTSFKTLLDAAEDLRKHLLIWSVQDLREELQKGGRMSESAVLELLPGLPPLMAKLKRDVCTRANYLAKIETRYEGKCYWDARRNWNIYEEIRPELQAWAEHFKRDPFFKVGEKYHNPPGSLNGMAWLVASKLGVGGSLGPLIDFEEHYQTCFLRRGLILYLTLLLEEQ